MLLPILHFNDVYRVSKQKLQSGGTIDVTQFAHLVNSSRNNWPTTGGLVLFSGDLFNPSVESSVTRGSHMVPVMNNISPDVALTGNHDFDFGYPHLCKLMGDCHFPWILSNIIDNRTGKVPQGLEPFRVFTRGDLTIGVIGLVEPNWITTVPAWPAEFEHRDMTRVGLELSELLRGEKYQCHVIIALTHSRLPNDISLAQSLFAHAHSSDVASKHGVDILFGGHDHIYYIGRGVDSWANYEHVAGEPGTEADDGVRLVKSGTDFRDLSEVIIELVPATEGVRRQIIKSIHGRRLQVTPDLPSSPEMKDILASVLSDVSHSMSVPVCYTLNEWDVRSEIVRTDESSFGNWIADVICHAYDDAINELGDHVGGADGVVLCGGALRGDSRYGPGIITLGDILEILPWSDACVVIEMDGKSIWDTMESALSAWPAQEGRFPVTSGFRIEWDSRRPPMERVVGIWLTWANPKQAVRDYLQRDPHGANGGRSEALKGEPIPRTEGGKKYKIVTREYMHTGHDGFDALVGKPCLVDDESGLIMSSIIRKFLLGSQFIYKMKQLSEESLHARNHIQPSTDDILIRARELWLRNCDQEAKLSEDPESEDGAQVRWVVRTNQVLEESQEHCRETITEALWVSDSENMSEVDQFDGRKARTGTSSEVEQDPGTDLVKVRPVLDGRLKDLGRAK